MMMRRAAFLGLAAVPLLSSVRARAQSDADPASSSRRPALRVLLGRGEAVPAGPDLFTVDGRSYRGAFQRLADGQIVNVVDLEEYLYSVLPREMPVRWAPAALQAQAICARTYVLQRSDPRRPYDLIPSELDQVYAGVASETPTATASVNATAGQVLKFAGAFAQVAYSSCCGGHTEAASDAWGSVTIPYLQGVVCAFCSDSPNYRWTTSIPFDVIATRFAGPLQSFGRLEDLQITERDPSGRARAFALVTDRGNAIVSGSAFRLGVGPRTLRSLLLTNVQRAQDNSVSIEGGGLGHGVGLCQWGSHGMALAGHQAAEILGLYFPGTVVEDLNR